MVPVLLNNLAKVWKEQIKEEDSEIKVQHYNCLNYKKKIRVWVPRLTACRNVICSTEKLLMFLSSVLSILPWDCNPRMSVWTQNKRLSYTEPLWEFSYYSTLCIIISDNSFQILRLGCQTLFMCCYKFCFFLLLQAYFNEDFRSTPLMVPMRFCLELSI